MKSEIGYNTGFEVREEVMEADVSGQFSILYLSDLHLNRFGGPLVKQLVITIEELHPDIILLGGDYADTLKGFAQLRLLLTHLSKYTNIYAIPGNHDKLFGYNRFKQLFSEYNIKWLHHESVVLKIGKSNIHVRGGSSAPSPPKTDFSLLFLHQPVNPKTFQENYRLAFAGHLHGCQFVIKQTEKGLYPGRWFYRWNMLKIRQDSCLYLISKGLGDTLPIRCNCRKDVILVSVKPRHTHV